jgi:hypothetical protein
MMVAMPSESLLLSIVIDRSAADVYEFAADPANLPLWAVGLASTVMEEMEGQWVADSPMGKVTVRFVDRNAFGVLDHVVTLPSGDSVYNPLRVIPYDDASEVVFTLRRQPGMTDDQFHADAAAVRADLASLKRILEERGADA